jgi:2-methylisocitrate lyase-like PEP mutase family enzyme
MRRSPDFKPVVPEPVLAGPHLQSRCELFRALHVPGDPVVLPNAWDVASAKAIEAAGFPAVATTSAGVAASLGYADHEGGPPAEMLGAAARIGRSVDIPMTVDAEGGYGMQPAELVENLWNAGAAGCNIEDTDHANEKFRDPNEHADWLHRVREAATEREYRLVINARIDIFLAAFLAGSAEAQEDLLAEGLTRARAFLAAGADCVFPIALHTEPAIQAFVAEAGGPVNILAMDQAPPIAELARLGVSRISYASLLHRATMQWFQESLMSLAGRAAKTG